MKCKRCEGNDWREMMVCTHCAALPSVRSEPLLAAYDRFKHLDEFFDIAKASESNPIHLAACDMWAAIKAAVKAKQKGGAA
jgi:hypothetical protein